MNEITVSAENIKDAIPLEIQGFVMAAIVVVAIMVVMTLVFWLMRKRLSSDQTVAPDAAAGTAVKTKQKEKQKTRAAAIAMGFMADDVERDAPADMVDVALSADIKRRYCARYVYPEHVESNAEWALLRRPAAPATEGIAQGWQLDWRKGEREPVMLAMIKAVTEDSRLKNRFFEMELARNALVFYWDEFGGKPQIEKLKEHLDQIKHKGAA